MFLAEYFLYPLALISIRLTISLKLVIARLEFREIFPVIADYQLVSPIGIEPDEAPVAALSIDSLPLLANFLMDQWP
jgi:hypothetical protein